MRVIIEILDRDLPPPSYMSEGASGIDLRASLSKPLTILPGKFSEIPTGIALAIPEGYEAQVRPRSGLAKNFGIGVLNSPGTIDSDYRGEIKVILINLGDKPFVVRRGDRIAQLVFQKVERPTLVLGDLSFYPTERGKEGFGHTGMR